MPAAAIALLIDETLHVDPQASLPSAVPSVCTELARAMVTAPCRAPLADFLAVIAQMIVGAGRLYTTIIATS